ncbi:MAG TPA: MerR family transcriptional regulator [Candidatus Marinimicrobia bacterium]|jgi:DNA-binding transcriptional MerR regulator|nr:transcriptional regulator [Candidatus Neomarinimicrobiota bacterium]MDP6143088.1 MerR family transcriptional regulator [Candidatus Neomarinimicrobiota bacterium]MDP6260703.1 MerR family transcriptional regulator [Candidatus Neomarinimicrobiota bacterium]MDP7128319.1 MerR family transcriptional regulator [Candidatus Neomarinimicrobiota bacterium]MDP7337656.1 MerR family transcriptional regulator [Candidatus Neomarinimicrobiota bacterium]|tara:strand:+ start:163 stop:519 length:357 start_codon:yes stop_codon:yes gene_type:complete
MDIKKLYYSIGEVSKLTGLKQYVLRYWETEFKQLNPKKNRSGNRTYRQSDIDTVLTIKSLLYDKKFTIVGARKQLNTGVEDMGDGEEGSASSGMSEKQKTVLVEIKEELQKILDIIAE